MTPEEAIEILEEVKELDNTLYAYSSAYMEALEVAISAIKEVQKYRKVGTAEECQKAVNYMHSSTVPVSLYDTRYHVDSYDPCNGCPMASCDDFYAQNPCYHCGRR